MSPVALVLALVAGWSSDDWRTRERASALAVALGPADASWTWAKTLTCPECRCRAKRAQEAALARAVRSLGVLPCCDAAWYDTARREYRDGAAVSPWVVLTLRATFATVDGFDDGLPFPRYRQATLVWSVRSLRAGTPATSLRLLMDELRRRDAAYLKQHGHRVPWE